MWRSPWRKPHGAECRILQMRLTHWAGHISRRAYISLPLICSKNHCGSTKRGAADDPNVHYHLGLAYQKANQPAQARQQLERVLKLNPNNNDARKALSELRG